MINSYTFGKFVVSGKTYESNIVLLGSKVIPWRHLENHKLELSDLSEIVRYKPKIVVIGTGMSGVMSIPDKIVKYLEEKKIKLIILKTKEACDVFNSLLEKGERVAGFLHNTC